MHNRYSGSTLVTTLVVPPADCLTIIAATLALLVVPVIPVRAAAHEHSHYKLIVLGTLGGPQGFGDAGHNAANINSKGMAAGTADTAALDPLYPLYNPIFAGLIGLDPYVYRGFIAKGSTLVDLGGLPGGTDSTVFHLTDNGLVSGQALDGSIDPIVGWQASRAVAWIDGKIIDLGTLGGYQSGPGQINSRGQVTGFTTNARPDPVSILYYWIPGGPNGGVTNGTQTRAFLWDAKNGMRDLGTLGGPDAFAQLINDRGQIVGMSYKDSSPNLITGIPTMDPFLWENGRMVDLGSLGGTLGIPNDLNNHGQVVGGSNLPGDTASAVFYWDNGTLLNLGTLGGTYGQGNALNEAGDVAGQATIAGDAAYHAFFWKHNRRAQKNTADHELVDLGVLPDIDATCVGAFGINSRDQVVGQAVENFCNGPAARAFLWEDGDIIDLNQFVPPGVEITLTEVEQINDRGEMFGIGTLADGNDRAFFLIPCDENHPNIEGCDYSPLEATSTAQRPAEASQSHQMRKAPVQKLGARRFGIRRP